MTDIEGAADGAADQSGPGKLRRGWSSLRQAVLQGTVISLLLAVALTVVTIQVDDRRAESDRRLAREETWRAQLVADSEFPRAVVEGLDLSGLYAPGVALVGARLRDTVFDEANLVGARLDGVDATYASFDHAQLDDAVFIGAALSDASFERSSLDGVDFRGADLARSNLRGASLFRTDMRGVDLRTADLDGADVRYVCFDDTTTFPDGVRPSQALCAEEVDEPEALPGAHYRIETFALARPGDERYAQDLSVEPGDARVLMEFRNIGVAPLRDVTVVADFPEGVLPERVRLLNGNYPDGFDFGAEAIQADGRQINVNLGNYNGGTNAFVEVEVRIDGSRCEQQLSVVGYATPESLGSVNDSASFRVGC